MSDSLKGLHFSPKPTENLLMAFVSPKLNALIRLALLGILVLSAQVHGASSPSDSSIGPLTPDDEIALIEMKDPSFLMLVGRRLIDPGHWKRGLEFGLWPIGDLWMHPEETVLDPDRPAYFGYGKPTFDNWIKGTQATIRGSDHFPTVPDLQKVHSLTFYNEPGDMFWGFYSRQIWKDFHDERRTFLSELLDKGQTDPLALQILFDSGIINGRGVIRNEGDTCWSGKPWDKATKQSLPYTEEEFRRLARNKILRPEITSKGPEGIIGKFWHPPGDQVEGLLAELFKNSEIQASSIKADREKMGQALYRKKAIYLSADFYRQLVLIHPLWDGVGRSSKQMRDWVLRYMGFLPPNETPENDMELTTHQYAKILDQEIKQTEKSYLQIAGDIQIQKKLGTVHKMESATGRCLAISMMSSGLVLATP